LHTNSENLAEIVDEEVREMVKKAYATTRTLLQDKYEGLKQVRRPLHAPFDVVHSLTDLSLSL
jgi:ATP-dependent Zn protease